MMEEHSQAEDHDMEDADQDEADDSKDEIAAGTGVFVTEIGPKDVLLGRGTGPANHQGNVTFRLRVESMKPNYVATASRRSKNKLVRELVDSITSEKGRFLRKLSKAQARKAGFPDDGEPRYEVVPDFVAVGKTKQAIRYVHYKKEPNERANQEDNDDDETRWANKRRQGVDSEATANEDSISRRKRALPSGILPASSGIYAPEGNLSRDAMHTTTAQHHHQLPTTGDVSPRSELHASTIAAYQAAIAGRVPGSQIPGGSILGQHLSSSTLPGDQASHFSSHAAALLQQQIQQRQFGIPAGTSNVGQHEQIARLLAFGGFPLVHSQTTAPAALDIRTQQEAALLNQFITNRLTGGPTTESTLSSSPAALQVHQEGLRQRGPLHAGAATSGLQQGATSSSIQEKDPPANTAHLSTSDAANNVTNPREISKSSSLSTPARPSAPPNHPSISAQHFQLSQPPAAGSTSSVLLDQYNERLRAIAEADTHYQSLLRAYMAGKRPPKSS